MLLQNARREARVTDDGDIIVLEDQDRSRWDRAQILEGVRLLGDPVGPYQIQAAIAACHDTAATPADTDWIQIAYLYGKLAALTPSPFVGLNRAVAVAMADGPLAGLALIDDLEDQLSTYHLMWATRADLLRRLDRRTEAAESYRKALALAQTDAERRYLQRRIDEVTG